MKMVELPIIQDTDLVVSAVERFAQVILLNIQEIFLWYFEQKGVDNPERFLGVNVENGNIGSAPLSQNNIIQHMSEQIRMPENPISQIINKIISVSQNKDVDISNLISKLKRNRKSRKDK